MFLHTVKLPEVKSKRKVNLKKCAEESI